jgi:hypothetical protein
MSCTVVTCYYHIKSKRSHTHYDSYITNLFSNANIDTNFVIFTSNNLYEYIQKKTEHMKNIKIIIKDFDTIELFNKYKHIWEHQYFLDKQKDTGRGIECYVLWNSKLNFLKEAYELNFFNSDKFIWMDIGMIRNNSYKPHLKTFPNYENISNDKIDIILLCGFNNLQQKFFQDEVHFSGASYGGSINALDKFHKLYYEKFDEYIENDKFIGCDQQIISSVYLENLQLFNPIIPTNTKIIKNNGRPIIPRNNLDKWFYLIYYYSQ